MGSKLLLVGLASMMALPQWGLGNIGNLVGSILMIVGAILLLLDK